MRIKLLQESTAFGGIIGAAGVASVATLLLGLTGCVVNPPPRPLPPPPPPAAYAGPPPNTIVYAYPEHGQSADQQSRDRYECSMWATHQTGFDPSAPNIPAGYRVRVSGPPPGTGTAVGAIAGAILGAAISGPYDRGAGAVFGGITGAMIGSASDASRAQQHEVEMSEQQRQMAQQAYDYRRALSACLDARGYSVK